MVAGSENERGGDGEKDKGKGGGEGRGSWREEKPNMVQKERTTK